MISRFMNFLGSLFGSVALDNLRHKNLMLEMELKKRRMLRHDR